MGKTATQSEKKENKIGVSYFYKIAPERGVYFKAVGYNPLKGKTTVLYESISKEEYDKITPEDIDLVNFTL